jgi:serine/threonine protein kinase
MTRAGAQFGKWTTVSQLGKGGNGEVWKVRADDGTEGAIKILNSRRSDGRYRLLRFAAEIEFLTKHPDIPGIVPLLDSALSYDPKQLSWYVMPIATPIKDALGDDPRPEDVVAAVAEVAETLARLAIEGIGHRDIKPDNLFRLNDHWAIGDFGLVTYPEKDPVTAHGRKLGPFGYMAPEMVVDADRARAEPADVWALSKTLWVLLVGYATPPQPGVHRPTDPAFSLHSRLTYNRARSLDLLLEQATQMDPNERVSMTDFARELRACLASPPEIVPSATLDELKDRIDSLTSATYRRESEAQDRRRAVNDTFRELQQILSDAYHLLNQKIIYFSGPYSGDVNDAAMLLEQRGIPYASFVWGGRLTSPGTPPRATVIMSVALRVMHDSDPAEVAGLVRVVREREDRLTEQQDIWTGIYVCPIGSAQLANAFADIRVRFLSSLDSALRKVAEILG